MMCRDCGERYAASGPYCSVCSAKRLGVEAGSAIATETRQSDFEESMERARSVDLGTDRPPSPALVSPSGASHRDRRRLVGTLLAISLLANTALAFVVVDLRSDLESSAEQLDAQLADAQAELDAAITNALSEVPDVDAVQRDLDDLEESLFGPTGRGLSTNEIGGLRRDVADSVELMNLAVASVEREIDSLARCFNDSVSRTFDSYERAANSYFGSGTYTVYTC